MLGAHPILRDLVHMLCAVFITPLECKSLEIASGPVGGARVFEVRNVRQSLG